MGSITTLHEMCDAYYEYEPGVLEPGGFRTYVNIEDNLFEVNSSAKLALDFYNRENRKKFNLVKVCKLNFGGSCERLIFCAQDDGSNKRRLFRCVVNVVDDEVLLCEIKYDAEISSLVDHVDDYLQKLGGRDEYLPSDTCSKDDLGDCSAPGPDGVILVSPTIFRIMGDKSFSDLHKMCDDYMDPCLYEKCRMMTSVDVNCFDWVTEYAKFAINFYNKKEQKNFILIKVERLYSVFSENQYCMTFWARNGRSDEFRLFRAIVRLKVQ